MDIFVYVLQYRLSGEDYQVTVFTNEDDAKQFAFVWLHEQSSYSQLGKRLKLDEMEEYCAEHDIAYIEITKHKLPTRWW